MFACNDFLAYIYQYHGYKLYIVQCTYIHNQTSLSYNCKPAGAALCTMCVHTYLTKQLLCVQYVYILILTSSCLVYNVCTYLSDLAAVLYAMCVHTYLTLQLPCVQSVYILILPSSSIKLCVYDRTSRRRSSKAGSSSCLVYILLLKHLLFYTS